MKYYLNLSSIESEIGNTPARHTPTNTHSLDMSELISRSKTPIQF